jgi:hypothetical protein
MLKRASYLLPSTNNMAVRLDWREREYLEWLVAKRAEAELDKARSTWRGSRSSLVRSPHHRQHQLPCR